MPFPTGIFFSSVAQTWLYTQVLFCIVIPGLEVTGTCCPTRCMWLYLSAFDNSLKHLAERLLVLQNMRIISSFGWLRVVVKNSTSPHWSLSAVRWPRCSGQVQGVHKVHILLSPSNSSRGCFSWSPHTKLYFPLVSLIKEYTTYI